MCWRSPWMARACRTQRSRAVGFGSLSLLQAWLRLSSTFRKDFRPAGSSGTHPAVTTSASHSEEILFTKQEMLTSKQVYKMHQFCTSWVGGTPHNVLWLELMQSLDERWEPVSVGSQLAHSSVWSVSHVHLHADTEQKKSSSKSPVPFRQHCKKTVAFERFGLLCLMKLFL